MKITMKRRILALFALTLALFEPGGLRAASAQVEQCTPANLATGWCEEDGNIGGSSAGIFHFTTVPLLEFDETPDPPLHYVNGEITIPTSPNPTVIPAGRLHVWTGLQGGRPAVERFAATDSYDGIKKLLNHSAPPGTGVNLGAGEMYFLDHNAGGCSPFVSKTKHIDVNNNGTIDPGETFSFFEATGCVGGAVKKGIEIAVSPVYSSSFHQVGGGVVKPLFTSGFANLATDVVPFKFVLGKGVKKANPITGALEKVGSLSRLEIEWLLSTSAAAGNFKWSTLGLVADADGDGVADSPEPNITRCLRAAGSGTKAALDETVMKDVNETPLGTTDLTDPTPLNNTYFGKSTEDIQDCIAGRDLDEDGLAEFPNDSDPLTGDRPPHPLAIGYLFADIFVQDIPAPFGDVDADPEGYDVAIDGLHAYDPTLPDPRLNVICGKYPFWANLRFTSIYPNFFPLLLSETTVNEVWVKHDEMHVFKNTDKGPIIWKTAHVHPAGKDHPSCGYNPPDPK